MSKSEQVSDSELNAAVGGRTQVTQEQYEPILAQRIADSKSAQNPP